MCACLLSKTHEVKSVLQSDLRAAAIFSSKDLDNFRMTLRKIIKKRLRA